MNILVIGSEGFIGSNIKKYFSQRDNKIISVDIVGKTDEHTCYYNLNQSTLQNIIKSNNFDLCIFCAGNANVQKSFNMIDFDYNSNTTFVHEILLNIKNFQDNCRFLHISSAAVYGNPINIPINESADLLPISPYGFHKTQAEMICKEFYSLFNIATCNIRPFSVYGPFQKKLLFWDLYQKSLSNKLIELHGTGYESRDFIFIDDFLYAIECIINNAPFNNDIINIANGIEISIKESVETFIEVFDDKLEYHFNGKNIEGNPTKWKADINKLKSFGYINKFNLKEGLVKYKEWIKENQY